MSETDDGELEPAPVAPTGGASGMSTVQTDSSAEQLVKKYMMAALAVGLVPFPLVDVAALTGIQLRMLSRLSSIYKVEFSDQLGKSVIGSLLGSSGSVLASTASTRFLLQLIPGGGWVAGIVSTAVFAGASTFAVGKVFIEHFSSGGTMLTFDPDKVRKYYSQQLVQGTVEVQERFAGVKP